MQGNISDLKAADLKSILRMIVSIFFRTLEISSRKFHKLSLIVKKLERLTYLDTENFKQF